MTQSTTFFLRRLVPVLLLLVASIGFASAQPRWTKRLPKADNDTYRYVVTQAYGTTESAAYDKAQAMAYEKAIQAVGLAYNSADLEQAKKTGKLQSHGSDFKIPINVVCEYPMSSGSGFRVYLLCQVAVAGNIAVEFTEYRHCGNAANDIDPDAGDNTRPEDWAVYEQEQYIYHYENVIFNDQDKLTEEEMKNNALQALHKAVLNDSVLLQHIQVKTHMTKTVGHAIAYIENEKVATRYTTLWEEYKNICETWLKNVDSYIIEGKHLDAHALCERCLERLEDMEQVMLFLKPYVAFVYSSYQQTYTALKTQANEKLSMAEVNMKGQKESKIYEYIDLAETAIGRQAIGDALRYAYASLILLADLPTNQHIKRLHPVSKEELPAQTYVHDMIKQILRDVQVTCDGLIPGSKSEVQLSFRYKNLPVTNINYEYNANTGWSAMQCTSNGWGTAFLPESNTPKNIHVKLDYRYETEAHFDATLPALMAEHQSKLAFDEYAKKIVEVVAEPIKTAKPANPYDRNSTAIHQNVVASLVQEKEHKVEVIDSAKYVGVVMDVCDAIMSKQVDKILHSHFTPAGQVYYKRLLAYGNSRIVSKEGCRYVRLGKDVQCRSIPMTFTFSKGRTQYENVVFTLVDTVLNGQEQTLIDGIQFALEERAARNIIGHTDIDETARLALINFMENYKTAFAMQNWDYVEQIFADDAVIITGRVISKANIPTDNNQIRLNDVIYSKQSKKQYVERLKNTKKEWINIKFGSTNVEPSRQQATYGISLYQDYFSSNYGDHGYLFLLIDTADEDRPIIRVRAWQPDQHFTMTTYEDVINSMIVQRNY